MVAVVFVGKNTFLLVVPMVAMAEVKSVMPHGEDH